MKYVSFLNQNKSCFGILQDENIIDLTSHYEQYREGMEWIPSLKSALEQNKLELYLPSMATRQTWQIP